jgi:general stress protein CsbA
MEKMFTWLQCKQECHGPIVCWAAALLFLLGSALALALLFAVVGFSMWVSPYLTAALGIALVSYLMYRQY